MDFASTEITAVPHPQLLTSLSILWLPSRRIQQIQDGEQTFQCRCCILIPSCVHIDTNIHSFLRHLDGGSEATTSTFTRRFGGTVSAGLAGSSEQGRIPTRAMRVAAGSAGTKRQPSGPSLGMAANLG